MMIQQMIIYIYIWIDYLSKVGDLGTYITYTSYIILYLVGGFNHLEKDESQWEG